MFTAVTTIEHTAVDRTSACSWFDGELCENILEHVDRWIVHEAEEVRIRVDNANDRLHIVVHQRVCPSLISPAYVTRAYPELKKVTLAPCIL